MKNNKHEVKFVILEKEDLLLLEKGLVQFRKFLVQLCKDYDERWSPVEEALGEFDHVFGWVRKRKQAEKEEKK